MKSTVTPTTRIQRAQQ